MLEGSTIVTGKDSHGLTCTHGRPGHQNKERRELGLQDTFSVTSSSAQDAINLLDLYMANGCLLPYKCSKWTFKMLQKAFDEDIHPELKPALINSTQHARLTQPTEMKMKRLGFERAGLGYFFLNSHIIKIDP